MDDRSQPLAHRNSNSGRNRRCFERLDEVVGRASVKAFLAQSGLVKTGHNSDRHASPFASDAKQDVRADRCRVLALSSERDKTYPAKTKRDAVGASDNLVKVLEGRDWRDWAKRLLLHESGLVADATEHCWLEKKPRLRSVGTPLPANTSAPFCRVSSTSRIMRSRPRRLTIGPHSVSSSSQRPSLRPDA